MIGHETYNTQLRRRCLRLMAAALLLNIFGNQAWVNAIFCAWISVGNLWMFGGLLATMKKVRAQ